MQLGARATGSVQANTRGVEVPEGASTPPLLQHVVLGRKNLHCGLGLGGVSFLLMRNNTVCRGACIFVYFLVPRVCMGCSAFVVSNNGSTRVSVLLCATIT